MGGAHQGDAWLVRRGRQSWDSDHLTARIVVHRDNMSGKEDEAFLTESPPTPGRICVHTKLLGGGKSGMHVEDSRDYTIPDCPVNLMEMWR